MDLVKDILTHPKLSAFKAAIQNNESLALEELWEPCKAALIALVAKETGRDVVVVSYCEKLITNFAFFDLKPLEFHAWETLPSEEIPPSPDRVGQRYRVLHQLATDDTPKVVVSSLQAALQKVLPKKRLKSLSLDLTVGEELPFDLIPEQLIEMGYTRQTVAADKGEFAVRGGILDLFPVDSTDPYRIEFCEDEIASIRKYDPIGQTSVGKVESILITPGQEYELLAKGEHLETLFDYLGKKPIVIFDDVVHLEEKYAQIKGMLGKKVRTFLDFSELLEQLSSIQKLFFAEKPLEDLGPVTRRDLSHKPYSSKAPPEPITFETFGKPFDVLRVHSPFLTLREACHLEEEGTASAHDLLEVMQKSDTPLTVISDSDAELSSFKQRLPDAHFEKGYLSSGFVLLDPPIALLPTAELTGRVQIRRQKQRSHYHTHASQMMALTPGESVVHMNSGIGRYLGTQKRKNHLGQETEYMLVEYAEGAKLYVPMEQANLVAKYIGSTDTKPQMDTLGSSKWKRARDRSEKAIMGYAQDLLDLQAKRIAVGGEAYPQNGDLVNSFENEFPYVETADQLLAINSVYEDMQSDLSMDRLVCGDVGYGKTEVAMRAAFKTVVDGNAQVAVLVPTTVLALQHYESFKERMRNFPISIGIVSRFQKPKEIKATLEKVEKGQIDILVGTHRIVSKDILFQKLGLVIIDEEQRFGVRVKEHLKKVRHETNCLTLSATPIPRTLYLSLVGARQLSCINTPPEDRLPIQSMICQRSDEVIKNALLRELSRDGQAYVIHNRVETIFECADKIRQLLPAAKIVVGHGQMSGDELDGVFHAFKSGKADILVATSIIENGIDIPNANTILIDRADRFGMADLYQMRGRVGRWNRKAYCYFMVQNLTTLNELSRKRLTALVQNSGHGGGMKIAMQDLEIRGAGNILGTEQSGHVQAIGFHFYCKLLKKAVNALKRGGQPVLYQDIKIEIPFDARLPYDYVNDVTLRMELYQRLGDVSSNEEIDDIIDEIKDRFGPPPTPVQYLEAFSKIRLFGSQHAFSLIKLTKAVLTAEQTHGKKGKITKKTMIKVPDDPEHLAKAVIDQLEDQFFLNRLESSKCQ